MAYEIFARKYRPDTFSELVGQTAIAKTLQNAVATEQVAPVYIFSGSHGVGKTSMARILAKALNCPDSFGAKGFPCGACETCKSIAAGQAIDIVEIDAASNRGIDDARQLRDGVYYRPASLRKKVYILDEFHQLSKEAFDALLKTFEEAPEHVCFILATTEIHKVPSTIRSRAQVFQFRRATLEQVIGRLKQIADNESIAIDQDALELIARRSRGSLRDSQKLFDQVVALSVGIDHITADSLSELMGFAAASRLLESLEATKNGDAKGLLEIVHKLYCEAQDPLVFAGDLLEGFRGLLYLKLCGKESNLLEDLVLDVTSAAPIAEALSRDALLYALELLSETIGRMRRAREQRVVLELAMVRLAEMPQLKPLGELVARLERMEKALAAGAPSLGELKARTGTPGMANAAPVRCAPEAAVIAQALPEDKVQDRAPAQPVSGGRANFNVLRILKVAWQEWQRNEKNVTLQKALEKSSPIEALETDEQLQIIVEFQGLPAFLKGEVMKDAQKLLFEDKVSLILKKASSVLFKFVEASLDKKNSGSTADDYPIVDFAQKSLHSRPMHGRPRDHEN
jgi:DNA polymerase III subunit gamma/tau